MKRAFFTFADIDYDHFNGRFQHWVQALHPLLDDRGRRRVQPIFLRSEILSGHLRSLSSGEPGQAFTRAHFQEFAKAVKTYDGVRETLVAVRTKMQESGATPVVAVITNAYADLIRFGPLFGEGLIDRVYGQEFRMAGPIDAPVLVPVPPRHFEPKVAALNSLMSEYRVAGASVLYAADGHSDGAVMEHLHRHGGRNVGFLNRRESKSVDGDMARLARFRASGWLDDVVENDFTNSGLARQALVNQAQLLSGPHFRILDNSVGLVLERDLIA